MSISGVDASSFLNELSIQNTQQEEKTESANDKDMFMKLLMAQIKNQDPLNPKEQTEFVAQLAQFSTLEGIQNLSTTVADIGASYRSSQALQATTMVGREVLMAGSQGYFDGLNEVSGVIDAEQAATDVRLLVKDSYGAVVATRDIGAIGSTATPISWDGLDNTGNPVKAGIYSFAVEGTANGDNQGLQTSMYSKVNSVSIVDNQGGMRLNLNGLGQVDYSEIQEVR